jgi:hypothetical protein
MLAKRSIRGLEAIGKHIALSIRVLVHEHGQSRALLDQLGIRSVRFLDSVGPVNRENLLADHKLVAMQLSNSGGRYIPLVATGEPPFPPRRIGFTDWWNEPVLKDKLGRTFCRRELVLHVANTDGGAHVDPELDQAYMDLSRANWDGNSRTEISCRLSLVGRSSHACGKLLTRF